MKKILIASHGRLAEGMLSTLNIIAGDTTNITTASGYVEGHDIKKEVDLFIDSLSKTDETIIFTDLYGGSVNQYITEKAATCHYPINIISGFNAPLVLSIALLPDPISKSDIESQILQARDGMKLVEIQNPLIEEHDEELDFFETHDKENEHD
ncbi:PTS fructose transporter subunit IIA [Lapidilactobacillus dextrinicus]|nr:hypothetical protein [Lapidilactobacillus dextrinicus]QFG46537.1 PTS fructose transporter subunit IIA [Lapidilactobacillus dextrinicus]